jgi:hypothetical protein
MALFERSELKKYMTEEELPAPAAEAAGAGAPESAAAAEEKH